MAQGRHGARNHSPSPPLWAGEGTQSFVASSPGPLDTASFVPRAIQWVCKAVRGRLHPVCRERHGAWPSAACSAQPQLLEAPGGRCHPLGAGSSRSQEQVLR